MSQPGVNRDVIGAGGAGVVGVENAVELARRHSAQVKSLALLSGETDRPGLEFLHQAPQPPELFVTDDNDEYPPTQEAMQLLYASAANPGKKLICGFVHRPADLLRVNWDDLRCKECGQTFPEQSGDPQRKPQRLG